MVALPIPRRLHTVSRVVLRRFTEDRRLCQLYIESGRERMVGVNGLGFTERVKPADAHQFEQIWKRTEDRLPAAFVRLDAGTALGDDGTMETLRTCLAMHMARSLDLSAIDDLIFAGLQPYFIADIANDRRLVETYPFRHRGLVPAGPDALRLDAHAMYERAAAGIENSPFRAERMEYFFQQALPIVNRAGLELCIADAGDFIISDAPAQSLKQDHAGVGVRGGVPWPDADTIMMPLGRDRLIALGPADDEVHVSADQVDYLNRCQVAAAHRWVARHPKTEPGGKVLAMVAARRVDSPASTA